KKVREYNIKHPVVNDANGVIWNNFGVRSWPTLVLIGPDGAVVLGREGESSFEFLDRIVGDLAHQAKAAGELDETPVQFFSESERTHKGGLLYPGKITADKAGNRLFITDTGNNRLVVTDLGGKFREAIGSGVEGFGDGGFDKATFNRPQGTCLVGETLYVADTENHAIRSVELNARTVKTVAGNGKQAAFGANVVNGTRGSLSSPWDIVPLPNSRALMIAMAGPHQIWRFDPDSGDAKLWAGSGQEDIQDGETVNAAFAQPSGLATDGTHLFVADSEGSAVRSIDLSARPPRVHTLVGTHDLPRGASLFAFGDSDGKGDSARQQHCLGVAFGAGRLFVADTYNNKIKVIDVADRSIKTLAGSPKPGASDNPPLFDEPGGLSVGGDKLYVADTNNHAIRVIDLDNNAVRTLATESIPAPTTKAPLNFKDATVIDSAPAEVAPGKSFTLALEIPLPKDYELNAEAPMTYLVEVPDSASSLGPENPKNGGRIEKPATTVNIPVPLAAAPKPGDTLRLRVSLRAMVCLPNTLCAVKNFVWNVPVTFTAGAPDRVTLKVK
ncbi:MAG TPA: NHL domain-containing thioredoxin family protein, partial [Isosphaeraceae bacterium]